jgi:hypothetical protein
MSNFIGTFQTNEKKPEIFLRLFIMTAFISITVILLLTGLSIHWIYSKKQGVASLLDSCS